MEKEHEQTTEELYDALSDENKQTIRAAINALVGEQKGGNAHDGFTETGTGNPEKESGS